MIVEIKRNHISAIQGKSCCYESMDINIHEHKRYYYTFDNSLLFTESIQNTTQIFPR